MQTELFNKDIERLYIDGYDDYLNIKNRKQRHTLSFAEYVDLLIKWNQ